MTIGNPDALLNPAEDVLESEVHGDIPMPITPGDDTERPEGVAFDVAEGTELPGVPTQTTATNEDSAQQPTANAEVPPGALNPSGAEISE